MDLSDMPTNTHPGKIFFSCGELLSAAGEPYNWYFWEPMYGNLGLCMWVKYGEENENNAELTEAGMRWYT